MPDPASRKRVMLMRSVLLLCFSAILPAVVQAQEAPTAEVVRNLGSPDPRLRLASVRLLRETRQRDTAVPVAALVTDANDRVQLEAIATELSFFLVADVPVLKRGALAIEARSPFAAAAVFDAGVFGVSPRPVPAPVLSALLEATGDQDGEVRVQALFVFGALARPPVDDVAAGALTRALDHQDAKTRAAAAHVIGRVQLAAGGDRLVLAINDSNAAVRHAAMRALGELREPRAVQALTEQFTFYGRGDGAAAALEALAGIGHAASIPLFRERLADRDPRLRRAAAEGLGRARDGGSLQTLELAAGDDTSPMVRAAMAFALQKLGRNFVARLIEFFASSELTEQVGHYLVQLGPSIIPALVPHLADPGPSIRAHVAQVLGIIGNAATIPALQPLTRDTDPAVARLAANAIERIKMHE